MAFSDFSLEDIEQRLGLSIQEAPDLFAGVAEVQPSPLLDSLLAVYRPLALAINTEKARSELLIAPILVEVRERCGHQVSLFSGSELNADPERGLNGFCDFILSGSPQQQYLRAPLVTIFEAKNENLKSGFAQCIAAMVGARVFNDRHGASTPRTYGAVTTGTLWRFLVLEQSIIQIDMHEWHVDRLPAILGILIAMVGSPTGVKG
jgi:hypothetical protein